MSNFKNLIFHWFLEWFFHFQLFKMTNMLSLRGGFDIFFWKLPNIYGNWCFSWFWYPASDRASREVSIQYKLLSRGRLHPIFEAFLFFTRWVVQDCVLPPETVVPKRSEPVSKELQEPPEGAKRPQRARSVSTMREVHPEFYKGMQNVVKSKKKQTSASELFSRTPPHPLFKCQNFNKNIGSNTRLSLS